MTYCLDDNDIEPSDVLEQPNDECIPDRVSEKFGTVRSTPTTAKLDRNSGGAKFTRKSRIAYPVALRN